MKLYLLAALILAAPLVSKSETAATGLRSSRQSANDFAGKLPGYRLIDTGGNTVAPRGCGPFLHWNADRFPDGKIPYYINKKGSRDLSLTEIKTRRSNLSSRGRT